MSHLDVSRRQFLGTTAAAAAGAFVPYFTGAKPAEAFFQAKNDRHVIGWIGTGDRSNGLYGNAKKSGDIVAVADVDKKHRDAANEKQCGGKAETFEDYRKLLERKDIDTVFIVTPDHWHTKIAIEAMKAGKDVYCEKPLTLTIDEGKQILKVHKETGRVFQVGTQQRTEMNQRFLNAMALVRDGRIGAIKKITCVIGAAPKGGPFPVAEVPPELNWDMWLGQAPKTDYIEKRCHYQFRWWYEYSGGKMTDWGAHHVDIASWMLGMDNSGPISVEGTATHPNIPNGYNAATEFLVTCKYQNGAEVEIRHDGDNGLLVEGETGRFFVSRGKLTGKPVEELADKPLPADIIQKIYKGKTPSTHIGNFFECIRTREQPISDVVSHHRAMTTCHLANIAIRLGRKLTWDPAAEQIVGDEEARAWQAREQRKGFEITT